MSNRRYQLAQQPSNTASHILSAQSESDFTYVPVDQGESGNSLNARLLYVTSAKYEGDWHSTAHSHAFSELFLVLEGKGQFLVNGAYQDVHRNDLVIVNPQVEHTEVSLESSPLEYIVLGVDGLQFSDKEDSRVPSPSLLLPNASSRIRHYMELLLDEVQREHPGHDAICQNLMNIILILIMGQKTVGISVSASRNISPECAAIRNYIDTHFLDPLTLEYLSQVAHQNKYYSAHAFKEAVGISPIRYLTERRVDEAKYLLTDTNYTIGEICGIAGFSSVSVFSQTFKRVTALTPNEYRKRAKEEKQIE